KYCPCGNSGCLERYVGRDGIIENFMVSKNKGVETSIDKYLEDGEVTPKAIAMAAGAGDTLSIRVLEETGKILGSVLATLVNALNPEAIIIGGGVSNAGELILGPARIEMMKLAYSIPANDVKLVRAELGNDAGLVGSASLAVANLK
ncbi:MAG: ROK family protein, partial [Candidatus Marinimicrobia bacterium]|nr:ROK family protein [Candidatus Neomarinimicrobiota bacterium]